MGGATTRIAILNEWRAARTENESKSSSSSSSTSSASSNAKAAKATAKETAKQFEEQRYFKTSKHTNTGTKTFEWNNVYLSSDSNDKEDSDDKNDAKEGTAVPPAQYSHLTSQICELQDTDHQKKINKELARVAAAKQKPKVQKQNASKQDEFVVSL